jgi:hypothetical protein
VLGRGVPGSFLRAACLLCVLDAGASRADSASCASLAAAAARKAYQALDYAGAARAADPQVCHDGTATELAEVLRWRAQSFAAQGDTVEAIRAFTALATVAPDYPLDPFLSPKVHELFQSGRAEALLRHSLFVRLLVPRIHESHAYARAEVYGAAAPRVTFRFNVGAEVVDVPGTGSGRVYEAPAPTGAVGLYTVVASAPDGPRQEARADPSIGLPLSGDVALLPRLAEPGPEVLAPGPPRPALVRDKAWIPAAAGVAVAAVGLGLLLHGNSVVTAVGDPSSTLAQSFSTQSQLDSTLAVAQRQQGAGVVCLSIGGAAFAAGAYLFFGGGR